MPAFGPLTIESLFDGMHDIAKQLTLKWARADPEEPLCAADDFSRLTLDSKSSMLFEMGDSNNYSSHCPLRYGISF